MTTEATDEWVRCLPTIKCEPVDSPQEDLITEFIPLESIESEYLPNSGALYQVEHNEHDYINTVLIENAHEEIVSSSCDETMKTKKDTGGKQGNSSTLSANESVPSPPKSNIHIMPAKAKNNSFAPTNIIFSDKTLNTIVLAPVSSASNSNIHVRQLSSSPQTLQTNTIVTSSKTDGQSSNVTYALYPNSSASNSTSVPSAVRGNRTSTILCSSISPIVSSKHPAFRPLSSPTTGSSSVKKIILQKSVKQTSKDVGALPSIPPVPLVEIHSSPPSGLNVTCSNSSNSQSSTVCSPSHLRTAGASSSPQTIVIFTSPPSTNCKTTLTTSKHLIKSPTVTCSSQNSSALRPSSVVATSARTIVIGTSASQLNGNSISSTVRSGSNNLNYRTTPSQNGGSARAINISKHVGTNTTHQISHRSIGINTQQSNIYRSNSIITSSKEICDLPNITGNKSLTNIIPSRSITSSFASNKVSGMASRQTIKLFDESFSAKNIFKRKRDKSPLSSITHFDENNSLDKPTWKVFRREGQNTDELGTKLKPNLSSNLDEQTVGSCPSSTNRELQVAIVKGEDAEPLTAAEAELAYSELVKHLKNVLEKADSPELRFQNSGMVEPGWFMCTCQDSTSLEWLVSLKSIECPDGSLLRVVRASELPWPSQVGFRIHGKDIDPESVLSLLQGQNKKLTTKKWNILEKRDELNSVFLIYFIDPDSVKALEEYQWMLCYEFTMIQVHLLRGTTETWKL